jgi:hypothetical protein
MDVSDEAGDEPAVFIFQPEETVADGSWETLLAGDSSDMRKFVRDQGRFDKIVQQKGDVFVASVHFGTSRQPRESLRRHVKNLLYLYGIVVFGNPCLNSLQSARWLEQSDYAGCPILRLKGTDHLFDHYQREHNMSLQWERWTLSLIRLALPHAKRRVAVILPPSQRVPPGVLREASARRIKLEFLPLSRFPNERIEAVRHQYLVYPNDADGLGYSAELQAAFGQSPDAHLDLLPERMRAQLELNC